MQHVLLLMKASPQMLYAPQYKERMVCTRNVYMELLLVGVWEELWCM